MILEQVIPEVVQGHPGTLVNDHDPVLIRKVQDLLGVRVVGRPERVGTGPPERED